MLHKNQKLELLKSVPLFSGCSKKELRQIGLIADEIDLPAGTELTREGTRGREFFVLVEGTADVVRDGRSINTMQAGDFFGEVALLGPRWERTATVVATSPMRLLVMARRQFRELLFAAPSVAARIRGAATQRA